MLTTPLQSHDSNLRNATPFSFGAPAPYVPLEFRGEVYHEETRVMGLSFCDGSWSCINMIPDCERRINGGNLS